MSLRHLPTALGAASLLFFGIGAAHAADTNPNIIQATRHDLSAPMRDILKTLPPQAPMGTEEEPYLVPNILLKPNHRQSTMVPDYGAMQRSATNVPAPGIDRCFKSNTNAPKAMPTAAAMKPQR